MFSRSRSGASRKAPRFDLRYPCRTVDYGNQMEAETAKVLLERDTLLMHQVYRCVDLHWHVQAAPIMDR